MVAIRWKRWRRRGLVALAWSGAVVTLMTYFRHVWNNPAGRFHTEAVWLYGLAGIVTFFNAVARGGVLQSVARRSTSVAMRRVLREIVEHCADHDVQWVRSSRASANVMILEEGILRETIKFPGRVARLGGVPWRVGEGACGTAVRTKQPAIIDLHGRGFTGQPYTVLTQREDGQPWWGITERQWEHTRDLAVVISVPLFDVETDAEVIGVVNLDTKLELDRWPHTAEDVLSKIQTYRWQLAELLEKGEGGDIWDGG